LGWPTKSNPLLLRPCPNARPLQEFHQKLLRYFAHRQTDLYENITCSAEVISAAVVAAVAAEVSATIAEIVQQQSHGVFAMLQHDITFIINIVAKQVKPWRNATIRGPRHFLRSGHPQALSVFVAPSLPMGPPSLDSGRSSHPIVTPLR